MRRSTPSIGSSKAGREPHERGIFLAVLLFYFCALVNPRDFPIANLPLVYPAFLVCALGLGLRRMLIGVKNTSFLSGLVVAYFVYFQIVSFYHGGSISLGSLANLLEPLLLISVSGAAAASEKGTKSALLAFVLVVVFSTACGIWIYFIGEPLASWRVAVHASVGGSILEGETPGRAGILEVVRNAGLSYYAFSFSYQLAVATIFVVCVLLPLPGGLFMNKTYAILCLVILAIGIVTNAERATLLSLAVGVLTYALLGRIRLFRPKSILMYAAIVVIALAAMDVTEETEQVKLHERTTTIEELYLRVVVIPIAAVRSVLSEPLGAAGLSRSYVQLAYQSNWANDFGVIAPHNHFANIVMYTGVVGVLLVVLLCFRLMKVMQFVKQQNYYLGIPIASAGSVVLAHSLTHNAGFFKGDSSTQIVLGLLWGTVAVYRAKSKRALGEQKRVARVPVA